MELLERLMKMEIKYLSATNVLNWTDFALLVEFRVKLSYTIYDDSRNRFVDERMEEILIPIVPTLLLPFIRALKVVAALLSAFMIADLD